MRSFRNKNWKFRFNTILGSEGEGEGGGGGGGGGEDWTIGWWECGCCGEFGARTEGFSSFERKVIGESQDEESDGEVGICDWGEVIGVEIGANNKQDKKHIMSLTNTRVKWWE